MVLLQLKATSELVVKRKEFLLGSRFLSRRRDKTFLLSLATEKYGWYCSKKENMPPPQSHPQVYNPNLLKAIKWKV